MLFLHSRNNLKFENIFMVTHFNVKRDYTKILYYNILNYTWMTQSVVYV